ncbi:undecaprenyl-diphosphatase [Chitinophaga sp. CF118]|uniref:phosphatase PAP2 family protein n=1 Tax=Chitinophaga sp. CF118 TaxID=1884367 RepID=UPI0008E660D9|nr:phosphatase PAP2 family protein [Chitinophaga sp. CF118]SFF05927.1 undecaprenyl-diphosphatase [Chitinophaga sp. CF118]
MNQNTQDMKIRYITLLLAVTIFYKTAYSQSAIQKFDDRTLEYLADHRTPNQTKVWLFISNTNDYVNVAIPVGVFVTGLIKNDPDMKQNALYIASSTATTALLNILIKKLVKRQRPFITNVHLTAVYQPGSYSFPSGHTSSAFSSATALSRAYPKWYIIAPSLLWSSAVGYSRMYLGVHNPSDVAAGALLGAGTAFGLGFLRP